MTTSTDTTRRAEGGIEWRGKTCHAAGHKHTGCPFRVRIHAGFDPKTGQRLYLREIGRGNGKVAEVALRELLNKHDTGLEVQPKRITVGEWLEGWFKRHTAEGHLGDRAQERCRGIIAKHLIPSIGSIRLQDLRADHINDLKAAWLSGEGSTSEKRLAGATVHKHLVVLHEALDDALKAGVISRNPSDAVSVPSVKSDHERRALTEDEITALVNAAQGTRYDVPIRFTLATGVRQGELLGLRWDDFDAQAGTITIQRTLIYVEGEVRMKPWPKTSHSRRTIELSAVTVAMLQAHHTEQTRNHLQPLIFPSRIGTPWIPRAFYRDYRTIVDSIGDIAATETVNFHTLRHTAASQWIRRGVDIFTVSRRLGHASASFTMDVYGHLYKGQQQTAAEALDRLLAV